MTENRPRARQASESWSDFSVRIAGNLVELGVTDDEGLSLPFRLRLSGNAAGRAVDVLPRGRTLRRDGDEVVGTAVSPGVRGAARSSSDA